MVGAHRVRTGAARSPVDHARVQDGARAIVDGAENVIGLPVTDVHKLAGLAAEVRCGDVEDARASKGLVDALLVLMGRAAREARDP